MNSPSNFSFRSLGTEFHSHSERLSSEPSSESGNPYPQKNPVRSGLLLLCHEIAFELLRRSSETRDPISAKRSMIRELMQFLPDCDEHRARSLMELAIELIHVKVHGRFERNLLDLSELIMRADNRLREVSNN